MQAWLRSLCGGANAALNHSLPPQPARQLVSLAEQLLGPEGV